MSKKRETELMKKVETYIEENFLKHITDDEKRERLRRALDIRVNKPEQEKTDVDKLIQLLFGTVKIGIISMAELGMLDAKQHEEAVFDDIVFDIVFDNEEAE
jgi:hypothetical protein